VNMEPCPCGCNDSIVACRIGHSKCPLGKDLVDKVLTEEGAGKQEASVVAAKTTAHK